MIWGTPIFWKHPYIYNMCSKYCKCVIMKYKWAPPKCVGFDCMYITDIYLLINIYIYRMYLHNRYWALGRTLRWSRCCSNGSQFMTFFLCLALGRVANGIWWGRNRKCWHSIYIYNIYIYSWVITKYSNGIWPVSPVAICFMWYAYPSIQLDDHTNWWYMWNIW